MKLDDKKLAVLELLQQQSEPISLNELLKLLGSGYSDRSLRRWLANMVEAGLVKKTGRKRGTRYLAAHRPTQHIEDIEKSSSAALEYISQPLFKRKPVTYDTKWLATMNKYYLPTWKS